MNIVYAMTRNVYEWILPSIKSLYEHNPEANVFIVCEDDELPFQIPFNAKIINVLSQTIFSKDSINYNNAFKYINLLKVCYPTILPELDKVIHLDIDTIICDDLTPLYNLDLTDKWVGACPEYKGTYKPFGDMYYNMGVAVINLEQMRKDKISEKLVLYLNTIKQPWADQDAWNKYGLEQDKFVTFPVRYNENRMCGYTNNPAIVHYCSIKNWWTDYNMYRVGYLNKYKNAVI